MRPSSKEGPERSQRADTHHKSQALDRIHKRDGTSAVPFSGARWISARGRRRGPGDKRGAWIGNARLSNGCRALAQSGIVQLGISTEITRGCLAALAFVVQAHDVRQLLTGITEGDTTVSSSCAVAGDVVAVPPAGRE